MKPSPPTETNDSCRTRLQEFLFFWWAMLIVLLVVRGRRLLRASRSMDAQGTAPTPATVGNEDWRRLMRGVL